LLFHGQNFQVHTETNLQFKDFKIAKKYFKILGLAFGFVGPVDAAHQHNAVVLEILAKRVFVFTGNSLVYSKIFRIRR